MELKKAFDVESLLVSLKNKGLVEAEKGVKDTVDLSFAWVLGSLAVLSQKHALWGIGQQVLQLAIPYAEEELLKAGHMPPDAAAISPMALPKEWDITSLLVALKAKGLPETQSVAKDVVASFFDWLSSSLVLLAATQPLWAVAGALLGTVQPLINKEFDLLLGVSA